MRPFLFGMAAGAALVALGTYAPSLATSLTQDLPAPEQRLPRHIVSDMRGLDRSLLALDRLAVQMDWAMTQHLINLGRPDFSLQHAVRGAFPAGASSISVVSESYGGCNRVLQIIQTPNGDKPKVVSRTSGHCDASPDGRLPRDSVSGAGDKPIAIPIAIPVTAAHGAAL